MSTAPVVSVLLPTRNRAGLLQKALGSVQRQTLRNIEILVLDDGSSDKTPTILKAAVRADPRVRIFRGTGLGAAAALNRLAGEACASLLAIMHDDDVALPARLERQVVEIHDRGLDVCGTWYRRLSRFTIGTARPPADDSAIKAGLHFQPPLLHPSVVMRRASFERVGGYDPAFFQAAEDYDLWTRLAMVGARFGNVPEILMHYRLSAAQASRLHNAVQTNLAHGIRAHYLPASGVTATPEQMALHVRVRDPAPIESLDELRAFEAWLLALQEHFHANPAATEVVARQWFFIGCRAAGLGMRGWNVWRSSPLASATPPGKAAILFGLCLGRVRYRSAPYRLLEPFASA